MYIQSYSFLCFWSENWEHFTGKAKNVPFQLLLFSVVSRIAIKSMLSNHLTLEA